MSAPRATGHEKSSSRLPWDRRAGDQLYLTDSHIFGVSQRESSPGAKHDAGAVPPPLEQTIVIQQDGPVGHAAEQPSSPRVELGGQQMHLDIHAGGGPEARDSGVLARCDATASFTSAVWQPPMEARLRSDALRAARQGLVVLKCSFSRSASTCRRDRRAVQAACDDGRAGRGVSVPVGNTIRPVRRNVTSDLSLAKTLRFSTTIQTLSGSFSQIPFHKDRLAQTLITEASLMPRRSYTSLAETAEKAASRPNPCHAAKRRILDNAECPS
ncbi:hypothetical protein M432DRAFT_638911 [Thermoascus aurantiacus ATCC 26904]